MSGENEKPNAGRARLGHASLMRPDRPLPTLPFASAATPQPERCRGGHCGLTDPGALSLLPVAARIARSGDAPSDGILVIAPAAVNGRRAAFLSGSRKFPRVVRRA